MTTASPTEARVVDWAGLPGDLLRLVCDLVRPSFPSRICFRAVCRSWRAADVQDQRPAPAMPPPWLVIPIGGGCHDCFALLSVPTKQALCWRPPGGLRVRCAGSSGGWLAGAYIHADRSIRVALLNPLTSARVDVPATYGRVYFTPNNPARDADERREEIALSGAVQKVAFSPSPTDKDFAVAVVTRTRSFGKAVAFARAGCGGWCAFADLGRREPGSDYANAELDVAYHDRKFYYMTTCSQAQVWVVDMAAPSPSPEPFARFAPPAVPAAIYRRHHLGFTGDGALHVVCRGRVGRCEDSGGADMVALRYDPSRAEEGSSSSPWVQATALRGHAFLIGDMNQTLPVAANGGGGAWLRPDSLYFTNANVPLCSLLAERRGPGDRRGVAWEFQLATGDIRRRTWNKDEPAAENGDFCAVGESNRLSLWIVPSMR